MTEFTAVVAAAVLAAGFAPARPMLASCKDGEAAIDHPYVVSYASDSLRNLVIANLVADHNDEQAKSCIHFNSCDPISDGAYTDDLCGDLSSSTVIAIVR